MCHQWGAEPGTVGAGEGGCISRGPESPRDVFGSKAGRGKKQEREKINVLVRSLLWIGTVKIDEGICG